MHVSCILRRYFFSKKKSDIPLTFCLIPPSRLQLWIFSARGDAANQRSRWNVDQLDTKVCLCWMVPRISMTFLIVSTSPSDASFSDFIGPRWLHFFHPLRHALIYHHILTSGKWLICNRHRGTAMAAMSILDRVWWARGKDRGTGG